MKESTLHDLDRVAPAEPDQATIRDWFDDTYRRRGFRYLRPLRAYYVFLEALAAKPGRRLLDVACGPGQLLRAACEYGVTATGVDLSGQAIAMCRQRVPQASARVANAESLPFEDDTFDYVTCLGSLERFLSADRAIREQIRVARPDAGFCYLVRNAESWKWLVWQRRLGRRNVRGHQGAATLGAWTRLFRGAGLDIVAIYPDPWPYQRWLGIVPGFRGCRARRPIRRGLVPLARANEFLFVLRPRPRNVAVRIRPLDTEPPERRALAALYEDLARHVGASTARIDGVPAPPTMHKRLLPPPDPRRDADEGRLPAGPRWIHDWLFERLAPWPERPAVLDVGFGLGATVWDWARRRPGRYHGLGLSEEACWGFSRFVAADRFADSAFELERAPLQRFHPSISYDIVCAIETLACTKDLAGAIARAAGGLRPGGRLALVEDMFAAGLATRRGRTAAALRRRWRIEQLHDRGSYEEALVGAGLRVAFAADLTDAVPRRPRWVRAAAAVLLRVARAAAARSARHRNLVDAYLGGLALEALYAAGEARYTCLIAERPREPDVA